MTSGCELPTFPDGRSQLQAQLDHLSRERFRDPQAGKEVPGIESRLRAIDDELRERNAEVAHLTLKAPIDGYVIPPDNIPAPPASEEVDRLPTMTGSPLEKRNIGALLKRDMLFCQIGDPTKMQAKLVIDQSDADLVAKGQPVSIKIDELPGDRFKSEIVKISQQKMKAGSKQLSHKTGGELQTKTDASGAETTLTPSYEALADLDDDDHLLRVGLRGRGKISATRWMSLGTRALRAFNQTFHFKL